MGKLDQAVSPCDEHGRYWEQVVIFSRSLLQIDPVLLQLIQGVQVHLIGHSKRLRGYHLAVGEETTLNPMPLLRLAELGGPVRGDCNELKAHFIKLGFDASQFAELLVAVRSPPSPVKNHD